MAERRPREKRKTVSGKRGIKTKRFPWAVSGKDRGKGGRGALGGVSQVGEEQKEKAKETVGGQKPTFPRGKGPG